MNEHSLKILEFPKIVALIRGKCLTPFGNEETAAIEPLHDIDEIRRRQEEVSQMKDIINFGLPFPLYRLDDVRSLLHKSRIEDSILEPKELLQILHLIKVSIELNHYDRDGREKFPLIDHYLSAVRAFPEVSTEINKAIDENGEIKDTASHKLRGIRSELGDSKRRIVSKLEQLLSKQSKMPGWQDDIVTMRNERYVIGIPTSQYQTDMGILHDRSQTGATFFVEPKETVELNNRINLLYREEHQEIVRILRALTSEIGSRLEPLLENCRLIGKLDALHACAGLSNQIKGNRPIMDERPRFNLLNARHPLLVVQFGSIEKVVPTTIGLDETRQAILVTGPNTGGKTISLKTIGLTILMAQSGLHVAAEERTEIGMFREIFADIGDEQSIELSLSTFSSHIRNIIQGLEAASEETLLLFDEIGAGTDPKEGSALAEAIILEAIEKKARLIATTHYSQLKTLAMEYPQVENASLDFDRKTLAPTYHLRLGIPGSSYAVEIAGRLGLPESVCRKASELVGSEEKSLDSLIASLEEELREIRKDRAELSERLEKTKLLEDEYRAEVERLKKEIDEEKQRGLADTQTFLEQTRREIENLVAEIRKSQASEQSVKAFHHRLKDSEKGVAQQIEKARPKRKDQTRFYPGDRVEIMSLRQRGEIDQLVGADKAKVKVGNVFTTVDIRNLKKLEDAPELRPAVATTVSYSGNDTVGREIHLRGMTGEEAIEKLDRFLDQAVIAGLPQVYVVHGKGTGALRRAITDYLKSHPEVASLRLGNWNEGGAGVTIVKLKE